MNQQQSTSPQDPTPKTPTDNHPDISGIYPDPAELSREIFEEQKKAQKSSSVKSWITFLLVILVLGGGFWYLNKLGIIKLSKKTISDQVQDEQIKTSISRIKTISSYHYREFQTYEEMDKDIDFKAVANEVKNFGGDLHLQSLGEKTFVAWVVLPTSKDYFCTDATGFTGKVNFVSSKQTTCK